MLQIMTTQEIAERLVELIRAGEYETAHQELYADDIVSIENPVNPGEFMKYKEDKGLEAVAAKGKEWEASMEELYGQGCSEPLVVENAISLSIWFDAKMQGAPERTRMEEIGIYWVRDGKIVREEFIY